MKNLTSYCVFVFSSYLMSGITMRKHIRFLAALILFFLISGCEPTAEDSPVPITAEEKPTEGGVEPFQSEPFFHKEVVFSDDKNVREPYLSVAVDGSILVLRNQVNGIAHLRRSEDGGESWGSVIEVPFGWGFSNFIIDENTGEILVVKMHDSTDSLWRSIDYGQTWEGEQMILKPNEVMKWLKQTGLKERGARNDSEADKPKYFIHANASESGITLRHGENKGRLIVSATFRPHAEEHPSDRDPVDALYSCAIYSDDGGATWKVSGFFPEGYTEEAALAELHDGRIYYNSRSHHGFYDSNLSRNLQSDEALRREAWSYDGGQTWEDLRVNEVLPDGGGYNRGYGMKGGLVRLPVKDCDILIYSNSDTGGGEREKMTVWGSFDGGESWPVKRLVNEGPSAYSSLSAGRPGTPSEGMVYLLFEGGPEHRYSAMQVARFNLSWLLEEGEMTGDGEIPEWVR